MNMQNQNQAKPSKIDAGVPKRTYKVTETGEVEMTGTVTTKVTFPGREFITFVRTHENDMENLNMQLSEEHRKELEKNKTKLKTSIDQLIPIAKDVTVKIKENAEREQKKAFIGIFKEQLSAKKPNNGQIMAMWSSLKDEQMKMDVTAELTNEEKATLLKIQNNATKEQRGKQ